MLLYTSYLWCIHLEFAVKKVQKQLHIKKKNQNTTKQVALKTSEYTMCPFSAVRDGIGLNPILVAFNTWSNIRTFLCFSDTQYRESVMVLLLLLSKDIRVKYVQQDNVSYRRKGHAVGPQFADPRYMHSCIPCITITFRMYC